MQRGAVGDRPISRISGMALGSVGLGIFGVLFGLIPLTYVIALACGVLASVLGALSRRHVGRSKPASWGIALGLLAVLLGVAGMLIVTGGDFDEGVTEIQRQIDHP